tara:strand:- start:60 stop:578 length:519 start_codon:yes stop_codon:yes gene_type:complete
MAKKYGIQIKGTGRALRPSGLGVLRPKPTGKGGKPLKPQPMRTHKADGGKVKSQKEIKKITGSDAYKKADYKGKTKMLGGKVFTAAEMEKRINKASGGKVKKKFPDLTGDGKVTRADVLKGRGVFRKGGRANTRRMNRLEELGRVDSEKAYSRRGKRNLKSEKKRIVRELNK